MEDVEELFEGFVQFKYLGCVLNEFGSDEIVS